MKKLFYIDACLRNGSNTKKIADVIIDKLSEKYTTARIVRISLSKNCDIFNNELKETHVTRPRFSPGYGDFPLEFQKDIFNLLSPNKRIGLTLNNSLLMSPTKSVTAVVGIVDEENWYGYIKIP